jgi:hypothetical protein
VTEWRWLTIPAAAAATGRSRRTIERWIVDERLAARTVGGTRYVPELALLQVERATRRAARQGRPGARLRAPLRSGVVTYRHSGQHTAPDDRG